MIYRFERFTFDAGLRHLRSGRRALSIRPKTSRVLQFLLDNRHRIVSKQELREAVWEHDFVEDHALFQLISEIRQLLQDKRCITTFPSRGYRWAWAVQIGVKPVWKRSPVEIGIGLATALLGIALWSGNDFMQAEKDVPAPALTTSPAMGAVAMAIELRARGDAVQALKYLEVAVAANPRFAAAKLELAQTLRMVGQYRAAQRIAYEALSDARIIGDGYLEATAHVVLSQLRWLEGDLPGAIQLNSRAARIANDRGHICAAQVSAAWQQQLLIATSSASGHDRLPQLPESSLAACIDALSSPRDDASGMSAPATDLIRTEPSLLPA